MDKEESKRSQFFRDISLQYRIGALGLAVGAPVILIRGLMTNSWLQGLGGLWCCILAYVSWKLSKTE